MTNGNYAPRALGPREAADEIREAFLQDRSSRMDPASIHALGYLKDVCANLGIEASPENITHVNILLREHNVTLPLGAEYPKWVDGKLVNNADEEAELHAQGHEADSDGPVTHGDQEPNNPADTGHASVQDSGGIRQDTQQASVPQPPAPTVPPAAETTATASFRPE